MGSVCVCVWGGRVAEEEGCRKRAEDVGRKDGSDGRRRRRRRREEGGKSTSNQTAAAGSSAAE